MVLSMREQLREQSGAYLPHLVAVFYAVFDPRTGPTVVHQVPEGSVATRLSTFPDGSSSATNPLSPTSAAAVPPTTGSNQTTDSILRSTSQSVGLSSTQVLFDFSSVLEFVIPKPELCGHLITKATRTSKILGFPVRIVDEDKYHKDHQVFNRNSFFFNMCFVFERDAEISAFEPLVRKTGRTLRMLEESSSLLSSPPPTFSMGHLVEQLFMDLNNFAESSIRIHDTNLELFLSPFYANPKSIDSWDVPIAIAALDEMKHPSWDVTLYKICSFINGVNHVKRIAELAEVDNYLARLCIQHLVFYSAVLIVDLFQFTNHYTVLPSIVDVPQYGEEEDEGVTDLRSECEAYVYNGTGDVPRVPFATLLSLYSTLRPNLPLHTWIEQNNLDSKPIDVRRMIQFGVIKGFLRRVHTYPLWLDHPSFLDVSSSPSPTSPPDGTTPNPTQRPSPLERNDSSFLNHSHVASSLASTSTSSFPHHSPQLDPTQIITPQLHRHSTTRPSPSPALGGGGTPRPKSHNGGGGGGGVSWPSSLPGMLDGKHSTDEICVRYGVSLRQLENVFRTLGGVDEERERERRESERERERELLDDDGNGGGGGGKRRGSGVNKGVTGYGPKLVVLYK